MPVNFCLQQVRVSDVIARTEQDQLRTSGGARVLAAAEQREAGEHHAKLHGRQARSKALDRRLRACEDHHPEHIVQLRETNLEMDPASQT